MNSIQALCKGVARGVTGTLNLVGCILSTIADLSVRGVKRSLEGPAADSLEATITRTIRGAHLVTPSNRIHSLIVLYR